MKAAASALTIARMAAKPRILVVEDESGIADTIQYSLATDGFTPVWCATARQALDEFGRQPPALAILDVAQRDRGADSGHRQAGQPGARGGG